MLVKFGWTTFSYNPESIGIDDEGEPAVMDRAPKKDVIIWRVTADVRSFLAHIREEAAKQ